MTCSTAPLPQLPPPPQFFETNGDMQQYVAARCSSICSSPLLHVEYAAPVLAFLCICHCTRIRHAFIFCHSSPRSNSFSVSFTSCIIALLLLHRRRSYHYIQPLIPPRVVMVVAAALWSASFVLPLSDVVGAHEYGVERTRAAII